MRTNTDGIILKEQNIGEKDKLVTVLTRHNGLVRAFVRGAKSFKNRKNSATGMFCYSKLSLYKTKDSYIIDEADVELLSGAGLLLNDVDQSATAAEFETNAAYIEYMGLIDQGFDINADNSTNEPENADVADTTVGNGLDRSETEVTDSSENTADEFSFETMIADIFEFIKTVFSVIFSFIV